MIIKMALIQNEKLENIKNIKPSVERENWEWNLNKNDIFLILKLKKL